MTFGFGYIFRYYKWQLFVFVFCSIILLLLLETLIQDFSNCIIISVKSINRSTSNDACRAELGLYPLKIEIQKRCVQFWHHLHQSDPDSIQYKALLANETSAESHPLNTLAHQLVHKTQLLTDYSFTPKTIIKEIDTNLKDTHDE